MRIEVYDRLTGRLRCHLNLITPTVAELIFGVYQGEPVTYAIRPDGVPAAPRAPWSKPCRRPGCDGRVEAESRSALGSKSYCRPSCRKADASRLHRTIETGYVASPETDPVHRAIRDQQVALFQRELEARR